MAKLRALRFFICATLLCIFISCAASDVRACALTAYDLQISEFVLPEGTECAPAPALAAVVNAEPAEFDFGSLTFTREGIWGSVSAAV